MASQEMMRGLSVGRGMEDLTAEASPAEADCKVCVAVHIRPIIAAEAEQACASCLSVTPGEPQVNLPVPLTRPLMLQPVRLQHYF